MFRVNRSRSSRGLLGHTVADCCDGGDAGWRIVHSLQWVRRCIQSHLSECSECIATAVLVGERSAGAAPVAHHGRLRRQGHQREVRPTVTLREV